MPFSTDTRTLRPGDTYVAIRGEVYDGHRFIPQAIEKGAAGIVTEQDVEVPRGVAVTRVQDSVDYLTEQARQKVARLQPRIVALTGSVGKTTTRAALVAVLREAVPVVSPTGNLNTPLGLALTVLNAEFDAGTTLVLEMGARIPGDIAELCALFPPTVSVVTNVKGVHLETLGSLDGVQREKGAIVEALGSDGTAVLNADDPRVRAMASRTSARVLLYGRSADADVRPDAITVPLPILGDHAVPTALAAVAVGRAVGMDDAAIQRGLTKIVPEKGRLARLRGRAGSTLVDDTYNASPDAVRAALGVLQALDGTRRVAFLGDMLELGADEAAEHAAVLREAVEAADVVFAVGPRFAGAAERLAEGSRQRVVLFGSSTDLAGAVRSGEAFAPAPGDVLLVKGSQGLRMERVSEALLHESLDPADVLPRQSASWKEQV